MAFEPTRSLRMKEDGRLKDVSLNYCATSTPDMLDMYSRTNSMDVEVFAVQVCLCEPSNALPILLQPHFVSAF